jgi:hypothetical protein
MVAAGAQVVRNVLRNSGRRAARRVKRMERFEINEIV